MIMEIIFILCIIVYYLFCFGFCICANEIKNECSDKPIIRLLTVISVMILCPIITPILLGIYLASKLFNI